MSRLSVNCNYCKRTSFDFKLCPECSKTHYCSPGCLKLDRPSHEKVCGKRTINETSSSSKPKKTETKQQQKPSSFSEKDIIGACHRCSTFGPTKRCTGCRAVEYCSKKCQTQDWPTHKTQCRPTTPEKDKDLRGIQHTASESFKTRSQEQTAKIPPSGRLLKLLDKSQLLYPLHQKVSCIEMIPNDRRSLLQPTVFVAFIKKYHEKQVHHGVYVLDARDKEIKVEFHLRDSLIRFPYEKVKPGNFICVTDPWLQRLQDGSMGIKIEHQMSVILFESKQLGYLN